jgi:hypothetical protein
VRITHFGYHSGLSEHHGSNSEEKKNKIKAFNYLSTGLFSFIIQIQYSGREHSPNRFWVFTWEKKKFQAISLL